MELVEADIQEVGADALLVGHWEGESIGGDLATIDRLLGGAVSDAVEVAGGSELSGKRGESALLYTRGALRAKRVVVVGLGKRADFTPKVLREATGAAIRHLRDRGHKTLASVMHRAILSDPTT